MTSLVQFSVSIPSLGRDLDIEVADDLRVGVLALTLAEAFSGEGKAENALLKLASRPDDLAWNSSLAELGVWSGSSLVLSFTLPTDFGVASLVGSSGRRYPLRATSTTIGRSGASTGFADVDLGSESGGMTVSRLHARIMCNGENWCLIHNPDATNPTLVGGHAVQPGSPQPLDDGVTVEFGRVVMVFHAPASGETET